jgi:hypothetical protein
MKNTDTFTGTAFDPDRLSMGFNYSITATPIAPTHWLFDSSLLGVPLNRPETD